MKKFIIIIILQNESTKLNCQFKPYWKSEINTWNSFSYQVFIIYCFRRTKSILKQYHRNFEEIDTNKSNFQKSLSIFLELQKTLHFHKILFAVVRINANLIKLILKYPIQWLETNQIYHHLLTQTNTSLLYTLKIISKQTKSINQHKRYQTYSKNYLSIFLQHKFITSKLI